MTVLPNASFEIAQQEMLTDFAQGGLILIFSKSPELNWRKKLPLFALISDRICLYPAHPVQEIWYLSFSRSLRENFRQN